jgi:MFS family permease
VKGIRVEQERETGSWSELRSYGGAAAVLAGGVLVGATSIYVAASLLPTAVDEIGGEALYAWNMTAFLVAQVVGTTLVSQALARVGNFGAYLGGFGLFATGSVVCAVSPAMAVMLLGRGVQGLGAGLLTGLGFALIYTALPQRLWARGVALVSAMFGVGNLVGPAMGGLFAQFGSWRLAFVVLAAAAVVMGALVPRVLPSGGRGAAPSALPVGSLVLIVATASAISVAGLFSTVHVIAVFIGAGLLLAAGFVVTERRSSARLLPRSTYRGSSPLRWIYATIMLLACGVAVEMFLPLFGQDLAGLPPAVAGIYAAALSLGWSLSQVVSASATSAATVRALQIGGPACLALGFAVLGLLQQPTPTMTLVLTWLPIVFLAGAGIGSAMPHLSVAAMTSGTDPDDGGKAASSVATVLTLATAFGAAVAGLLVNLGLPDLVTSARLLLAGFTLLAAVGVLTAWRATGPAGHAVPAGATGRGTAE